MNDTDARRIIRARALMWENATADQQDEWLHRADDVFAELEAAAARPVAEASSEEGEKAGRQFAEAWRWLSGKPAS